MGAWCLFCATPAIFSSTLSGFLVHSSGTSLSSRRGHDQELQRADKLHPLLARYGWLITVCVRGLLCLHLTTHTVCGRGLLSLLGRQQASSWSTSRTTPGMRRIVPSVTAPQALPFPGRLGAAANVAAARTRRCSHTLHLRTIRTGKRRTLGPSSHHSAPCRWAGSSTAASAGMYTWT